MAFGRLEIGMQGDMAQRDMAQCNETLRHDRIPATPGETRTERIGGRTICTVEGRSSIV